MTDLDHADGYLYIDKISVDAYNTSGHRMLFMFTYLQLFENVHEEYRDNDHNQVGPNAVSVKTFHQKIEI